MMNFLRLLLLREVCIAHKHFGDNAIIVIFLILAAILFPLGVGPEPKLLAIMGPGILWVIALLASLLSFGKDLSSTIIPVSYTHLTLPTNREV